MYCPNCGTANEGAVRFCANCGTPLETAGPAPVTAIAPPQSRTGFLRFLGIGCLVLLALFVLFGLGCTRACFGRRRFLRRRFL
jgi:hypothetical protein